MTVDYESSSFEAKMSRIPGRILVKTKEVALDEDWLYEVIEGLVKFDHLDDAVCAHTRHDLPYASYDLWLKRLSTDSEQSKRLSNLGILSVEFHYDIIDSVIPQLEQYGRICYASRAFEHPTDSTCKLFVEYEDIDDAVLALALEDNFSLEMEILDEHTRFYLFSNCLMPMPVDTDLQSYTIDLNAILSGEDRRTTCMIRNIPNKYTQPMLIEWLDSKFPRAYDFLYLRMDFRNHCNVGYAFINFIDYRYFPGD